MTSRVPFYLLVSLLVIVGIGMSMYRHDVYGVPWTAGQKHQVWEVEARVEFEAKGDPVKVSLATPDTQNGFTLINENTSSPGYGFALVNTENGRRAEWTKREAAGQQILYFKNQMLVDDNAKFPNEPPIGNVVPIALDGPLKTAADAILTEARQLSADNSTLTRELIKQFNDNESQNAALLTKEMSKADAVVAILSLENIHARVAGALQLEDGRRRQNIIPMVEIWDGEHWQLFNLETGSKDFTKNLLLWNEKGTPLLEVTGGTNSQVSFSIISQDISPKQATDEKIQAESLLNFSIHSLPIEEQAMFKTIMLVPIGALIVVLLRVLVGLKTSGTFMPVLIAVAFVQTQLVPGIVGFLLIVGTGLIIRSYLSRLNLLLVARISAVIITVILIIAVFTVVAFKIGLVEGLSITFFPMIILSWTIERMSIIWEEEGPKEVLVQGGGSLLTAVLVYLAMTNDFVRHITFNFIGIQLVILAVILMLGNYTGYRLSELKRFKPLVKD
ncbi:gonadoliberin III [Enterovibrio norvegicus FF-454]|uniref:Gonadoliberin III n=1 Tax=Enterovibrio norvegicus FF-454 TaxID=1185651 RepID=A0A1E5C0I7_9GAMM|nr:inactive transglutaminase family protein [Enterovibrio norvegicus]OEE59023.1 gonadoliberin III [Enterovibrio norvegicus FF-454]